MKHFILCFILLCGAVCLGAQAPGWEWAVRGGGSSNDQVRDIAIDGQGNHFIIWYFLGTAVFGPHSLTSTSVLFSDIFVAKLDAAGNWLWAVRASATLDDEGYGIAVDNAGNALVTGYFMGDATFGSYTITSSGQIDAFAAKLDPSGNWLWARQAGGSSDDYGYSIAVDDTGNTLLTGCFKGSASLGTYTLISMGNEDIFIAKLDAAGNWLWARRAGGTGSDKGYSIAVDSTGNTIVTGTFYWSVAFGAYTLTSTGNFDIFSAKLDAAGNWLWAVRAGGPYADNGRDVAVDIAGNAYLTGEFGGNADFGTNTIGSWGDYDVFAAKLDPNGNWLWACRAGGGGTDGGRGIDVNSAGKPFLTGYVEGSASFGLYTLTSAGSYDIFAARLDTAGNWLGAVLAGGTGSDYGENVAMDGVGNAYLTGNYSGSSAFGTNTLTSSGSYDIFVAKLIPRLCSPDNVHLEHVGASNLLISWDPVTQNYEGYQATPDAYMLYVSAGEDPGGPYVFLAETTATSFTIVGGANAGRARFYRITADDD